MKEKIDIVFKVGLLLMLLIFLFFYGQSHQNGRYQLVGEKFVVLDTKTGDIYVPRMGTDASSFFRIQSEGWHMLNVTEPVK